MLLSGPILISVPGNVVPWSTHWDIRILVPMSYLKLWNYIYIYIYISSVRHVVSVPSSPSSSSACPSVPFSLSSSSVRLSVPSSVPSSSSVVCPSRRRRRCRRRPSSVCPFRRPSKYYLFVWSCRVLRSMPVAGAQCLCTNEKPKIASIY